MSEKSFPVEKVIPAIAASLAANRDVVLRAPHGITDVRDVRLTSRMKELARRWRRMVLPFRRERVAGACFCQTDGGTGAFGGSPV